MAIVNADFLSDLLTTNQRMFVNDYDASLGVQGWMEFTSQMNSSGKSERYAWLGSAPTMQDVTHGQVQFGAVRPYNYTLDNLEYQGGFEVSRAALEDDDLQQIPPRISDLANEAAAFPGRQILQLFEGTATCYDGKTFFNDAHSEGDSGTIDNNITVTVTSTSAPTSADVNAIVSSASTQMRAFKDDNGRILNRTPDLWVCPPALAQYVWGALSAGSLPSTNAPPMPPSQTGIVNAGPWKLFVNPYLTSSTVLYGLRTMGSVKPFIYQTRLAPSLESITNPNTDAGIMRRKFPYTVRSRHAVGYGDFRDAIKVTIST